MVFPIPIVTDTIIGEILFGRICFVIVLGTEQFIFCAASIYSIFRTPMIEPRRSRTVIGMPPIERASTVLKSPLPRHAEIAIARRIPGIA